MSTTPTLSLARYRLSFRATVDLRLPAYTGSAWRGAFGHALRRLVCVTREPACPPCLLYRSCIYPYLFETPPDPRTGKLTKYTAAPHPYGLIPHDRGGIIAAGETLTLDVHLFGHGNRHLPYVIHALNRAGQQGLGQNRGRLELLHVAQADGENWPIIYTPGSPLSPIPPTIPAAPPCPERLTLRLLTPLRLTSKNRLVSQDRFQFHHLFSSLLRRISLLTAFHTDDPLETGFAGLTQAARAQELRRARLHWHEWTRYSSRQDALVKMGGLAGEIEVNGPDLELFWPYLWLGQWTLAGKGAVMGLGRYELITHE
ncbi:MAG: CRISPR system precrRNA processing endoribonuclease RAMP protein Cas6 [Candidatus Competibacteraceae bacterium]|nr:CRISPR system precrRNA processing endoribonuclease RAMP protein Cas6 [Candidatus Competibacteraceae bacterium]MCP5133566.1 CRISPR system precrRNA processing endoribonuclease RAMP protein Cas6 [Gammaproteobacteria bacterium]